MELEQELCELDKQFMKELDKMRERFRMYDEKGIDYCFSLNKKFSQIHKQIEIITTEINKIKSEQNEDESTIRNTMLEFQDVYTKTFEQYEQLKVLRNKLNALYEKLMNQDETFSKLTDEEKSKCINDFKNKSFDEIIRNNTSYKI